MRPFYLIINSMLSELGVDRVAKELGVSTAMAYKYGQDPDESGKEIPTKHLISLLTLGGDTIHIDSLQTDIDDALSYFTRPVRRKVVTDALLNDLDRLVGVLREGGQWKPKSVTVTCPQCTNEMFLIKSDQGPVYVCRDCLARVDWK